jgi:hypothetical protein
MPYYFACPHCGEKTLVEDQYAGLSGPCINCGKQIQLPQFAPNDSARVQRPPAASGVPAWVSPLLRAVVGLVALVAIGVGFLSLGRPAWQALRAKQLRGACADNLERIGLALKAYEEAHGCLPPAYFADANGKPMHSWRVIILPYLGAAERQLHAGYDYSKPWDAPENAMVLRQMPAVYACPADSNALSMKETNYMVVVGSGTMFPGNSSRRRYEVTDSWDNTILVVEIASRGVAWTEPKDLDFAALNLTVNDGSRRSIGGNHEEGANVLLGDYKTILLEKDSSREYVEGLLTTSGGEQTEAMEFSNEQE